MAEVLAPSPPPWVFSSFTKPDGSPIETVEDVVETVAHSARQSDRAELWGVSLDDKDEHGRSTIVCYTGNGPRGRVHAELIARAVSDYLAREQAAEPTNA